ncbi:pertactin-like passenger domain-containing protein [Streptobacillus moniliformis]|uniref:pertactin-like passenger domain-containing protein n=1 Tax=Streptobacillus moniliformis TaxID=34105 RepID=UPI0007E2F8FB|nr:pertactin-like passenger domain-containing protein [Streptobacillus moniliformis]
MVKNKYMGYVFLLMSILANAETVDEKINEDIKKMNEIESKIKYDKTYKDPEGEINVGNDEKANFEFNKDFTISKSAKIYSKEKELPNSLKIVNNANISLEKNKEFVIAPGIEPGIEGYSNLIHMVNNKKIETSENERLIDLRAKNIYFKNSANAIIENKLKEDNIYRTAIELFGEELTVLDNAGTIYGYSLLHGITKLSVINRKTGIIDGYLSLLSHQGSLNLKNEGKIRGERIYTKYMSESTFVNSGTIDVKMIDYNLSEISDEDKGTNFLNDKTGIIKIENMFFTLLNLNFQNFGNIEASGKIEISSSNGKIENNNRIKGNVNISHFDDVDGKLLVNLQNGVLEGDLKLEKEGFNETIVTIKSMSNVTGNLISEGNNDTLRLIGSGEVKSKDKFKDFEKIHLQNSDWTFNDEEYKVNNEILVEASKLSIKKGDLKTKKFTNNERSTINILKDSNIEVEDKFVNKGLISFLNSKDNTSNLSIKGNYVGENSKLLMRTYIDKNESDILKLDGSASGSTGVEISNPNSTLNKRMKNKLKLIETKSSTKDAFTLLNSEYGIYRYGLNLEGNDWYLSQKYNKLVLGVIANSIYKAKNEFNLKYSDHNGNDRFWSKSSTIFSKNTFTNNNGYNLNLSSNTTNIFVGYDIGKKDQYKYGVFGNIGFEKISKGETGVFGLGLYGTWNNKHFYADSWLNYMYSQNRINTDDVFSYGLHTFKSSIEVGTKGDMYIGKNRLVCNLYEQLIFSYVSNPNIEDVNNLNNVNIKSRLGTNLTLFTHFKNINPYIEFNWSYDTRLVGVRVEKEEYLYNNNKNTFELKWGLREMNVNDRLSMWVNIVHRFNEAGYMANGVEAGMVYKMI